MQQCHDTQFRIQDYGHGLAKVSLSHIASSVCGCMDLLAVRVSAPQRGAFSIGVGW